MGAGFRPQIAPGMSDMDSRALCLPRQKTICRKATRCRRSGSDASAGRAQGGSEAGQDRAGDVRLTGGGHRPSEGAVGVQAHDGPLRELLTVQLPVISLGIIQGAAFCDSHARGRRSGSDTSARMAQGGSEAGQDRAGDVRLTGGGHRPSEGAVGVQAHDGPLRELAAGDLPGNHPGHGLRRTILASNAG